MIQKLILSIILKYQKFKYKDITIKIADNDDEHNQIHKLNYKVFVHELGQEKVPEGKDYLVDRWHGKNVYFIAKKNEMIKY